jgi:hypothetical protein
MGLFDNLGKEESFGKVILGIIVGLAISGVMIVFLGPRMIYLDYDDLGKFIGYGFNWGSFLVAVVATSYAPMWIASIIGGKWSAFINSIIVSLFLIFILWAIAMYGEMRVWIIVLWVVTLLFNLFCAVYAGASIFEKKRR